MPNSRMPQGSSRSALTISTPRAVASQWKAGESVINDERDLKRWIGLVHEDEFPLGNFHLNLQRRLAAP